MGQAVDIVYGCPYLRFKNPEMGMYWQPLDHLFFRDTTAEAILGKASKERLDIFILFLITGRIHSLP